MNKKVIITILAIILIIGIAILTGVKLSKDTTKEANTNPSEGLVIKNTETPSLEQTLEPEITETTETPEVIQTSTPVSTTGITSTESSDEQKKEYAKQIAKENWEKLGVDKQVYYSYDSITSEGKYLIAVRDESTTEALVWYQIDIKTGTCEVTY